MNKCKGEYCPFNYNCKRYLDYKKGEIAMESPFHPVINNQDSYCDYQIPIYSLEDK